MQGQAVVPPEVEHVLTSPPQHTPRAEHLEPFLQAAREVLELELGTSVQRGKLQLWQGSQTTQDITVIIGITGELTGLAIYGLSEATALAAISRMMGTAIEELDDLALSGIAELGNCIAGRATTLLGDRGIVANIAPPVLLQGAGSRISTAGIMCLVVPLATDVGTIEAQLAIKGR
ncbi:MAG TPA: chemotaxis protein CheX [Chloroflexota bacterium]|jgi:chemotaxis protein CheX|nr:chemotaxis protein CheX [Chloroflexota bacterium]